MKTTIWINQQRAAVMVAAMLLASGMATVAPAQTVGDDLSAPQIAAKTRAAYAALASYSDSGTAVSEMSGQNLTLTFTTRLARTNLYRIDWTQGALKGVVWSQGSGDFLQVAAGSPMTPAAMAALSASGMKNDPTPQKMRDMRAALGKAAGLSYCAACTIPGAFFNRDCGDAFIYPAIAGRYPLKRETDGTVGQVDCHVVSTEMDLSKAPDAGKPGTESATLWIGKEDFLVHQTRTRYVEKVDENELMSDQMIDNATKKSLEMQNKPVTPEAIAAMRPQMRATMKQVGSTLKASFKAGIVMTQTHENISVNQNFSPSDFAR